MVILPRHTFRQGHPKGVACAPLTATT